MKSMPLGVVLCVILSAGLRAQNPKNPARSADDQWNAVINLSRGSSTAAPTAGAKKTPAQRKTEADEKTLRARAASAAANEFHVNHPTHVNAGEARKLEALLALQGVIDADVPFEQSAQQVARSYLNDSRNPAPGRFEVAVLSERVQARAKLGGKVYGNNPTELEKIADKLLRDFGDLPDAFYFYASVTRAADMETGQRMATKLLQTSAAPAEAKADAQAFKDRLALVGTTLDLQLRPTEGSPVHLGQQAGKLTILYVFSAPSGTAGMTGLLPVKKLLPADAQVIYLALGSSGEQVQALQQKKPVPGVICVEPVSTTGAGNDLLKVRHTPYVYILNRTGKLQSFGAAANLPALLAAVAAR